MDAQIAAEAEALAGPPIRVNSHGGPEFDPVRMRKAQRFTEVARGKRTPLRVPEVAFRKQKADNWQGKTWGKYDRIMALLESWQRDTQGGAAIEGLDRKAAGAFIGETLEAQGWTAKTMNGYLSCLRQYWRWMIKRGYAESNPWDNQQLEAPRQKEETKERPFTKEEMRKLIYGQPSQAYLSDLMRLAALTGARLGALVELRVRDCQDGVFMIPPQKSEPAARRVPIHSDLAAMVARRCEGKAGDDWLFPEVPPLGPDASPSQQRSNKAGKAFKSYREKLGVKDKVQGVRRSRVNFHSFRRWFITEAERALGELGALGFTTYTISEVVGHKVEGMTFGTYKGAASDAQRRACVEAVRLPEP
ncbi:tyrosine-type recombinase/integrase [Roseinatronobacter sp. NSM]|uniref:tyrosine-type recombinase/integrase n=1 Tax=Roseinatronobacter sp. NSM TaxID=3457785 RepID=UPI004035E347